jgi:hypothetical protein
LGKFSIVPTAPPGRFVNSEEETLPHLLIGRSFADAPALVVLVEQTKPPFDGWLAEGVEGVDAKAGVEKISTGAALISSAKMA